MIKIIFTLLLISCSVHAQEDNIWYFGGNAGLDFNNGAPVPLTDGQLNTLEGCASIAGPTGDLLFYTDGVTVWNKNHLVMENGLGLMGHISSIQSALIVQRPGTSHLYYIFTTTAGGYEQGLRYSIVDMNENNGLGSVTNLNVLLHTPTTEALSATYHSNGEDIWIISHNYNSNLFSTYLVTSNGVAANPVISPVGVFIGNEGQATIKISPDGSKLALSNWTSIQGGTQLFDFDSLTGSVSNPLTLTLSNDYSTAFSPSGNILYLSNTNQLIQYDLLANDITSSALEVFSRNQDSFSGEIGSLRTGPDNKIYIARKHLNIVSIINNPDILGMGCNVVENGIVLGESQINFSAYGLPNTVLPPLFRINAQDVLCLEEQIVYSVSNAVFLENMHWDFGDGTTSQEVSPSHSYQAPGIYVIRLTAQRQGITRNTEFIVTVVPTPLVTLAEDLALCDEDNNGIAIFDLASQNVTILAALNPDDYEITYHTALDQAESGNESIPVIFSNTSNPQTIYARVEDKSSGCYATTSFRLIVRQKPVIAMPDRYALCEGSSVTLIAPEGFDTYSWSNGETTRSIVAVSTGTYTLTVAVVASGILCENAKTISVYQSQVPEIIDVHINDWTASQNSITISASGNGDYEYSIDGIIYQDSSEFYDLESGIHTVFVRDINGCGSDSQDVTLLMYPKFFTPNGDGINDVWRIKYSYFEPKMRVHILDRYGKRLASFDGVNQGWDGTHNGTALPATDYWFIVERHDGRKHQGHFSMIR